MSELRIYNTLTGKKDKFIPLNPPFVGLYVCGPTVYSDVHLGNVRSFISFDMIYRHLRYLGYQVRYVRNITDVGHLETNDRPGENVIEKQAVFEKIEPMEIVQKYTNGFHEIMSKFNTIRPDIEPTATGHIQEQIAMIKEILDNGFAYEKNGSVYFDVLKYMESHSYGHLSGRVIDDLMNESRELEGVTDKKNPVDFVLWKHTPPEKLMRYDSPWGKGVPGWHLECSVMGTKYLGEQFDIHGGGNDLKFPHHECEIAQNMGARGKEPVRYWMHGNMLTMNGVKMSKSLGNVVLPAELLSGNHPLLEKGFSPMTIRFFMMQTHYRSTLDFSNDALKAAEKGYKRLISAYKTLQNDLIYTAVDELDEELDNEIRQLCDEIFDHLNNDFNTPMALANLFELVNKINGLKDGHLSLHSIRQETFDILNQTFKDVIEDILGLQLEEEGNDDVVDGLVEILSKLRLKSRENKDYTTSDQIRDELDALGIVLKDGKEGTTWSWK